MSLVLVQQVHRLCDRRRLTTASKTELHEAEDVRGVRRRPASSRKEPLGQTSNHVTEERLIIKTNQPSSQPSKPLIKRHQKLVERRRQRSRAQEQAQRNHWSPHWFRLAATSSAFSYACIAFSVCGPMREEESTEPIIAYARGAWQQPTQPSSPRSFHITADTRQVCEPLLPPESTQLQLQTGQVVATQS